jgi:hypothetical protein
MLGLSKIISGLPHAEGPGPRVLPMLMNKGGKLIATPNLVAAPVASHVAVRVIFAQLVATSVTGDLDAVRLRDNAADFVAASICQDFVCHSDLAE